MPKPNSIMATSREYVSEIWGQEEEFYFLHYKVPCCLTFFCIGMDFFYNLKFIRGIIRRKKIEERKN